MSRVDLNADLGEGMPGDEALMPFVTRCNIACGGHAGDALSMKKAVQSALRHGVAIGAHPSYPDREGFGRRELPMEPRSLMSSLRQQVVALQNIAGEEGLPVSHLKPHGALYNKAARDPELSERICDLVEELLPGAFLVALPTGTTARIAAERRIPVLREGFADRRYLLDGSLQPRSEKGSVLETEEDRAEQALALATGNPIQAVGGLLTLRIDTICLHGDSEGAAGSARAIRRTLEAEDVRVEAAVPGGA